MTEAIKLFNQLDSLLQDEDLDQDKMKDAFEGLLPALSDYLNGVGPIQDGASLILKERREHVEKHGWKISNDADYAHNELIKAALFCISPDVFEWPFFWMEKFRNKILLKSRKDQLKVAGSFIAAAIDRIIYIKSQVEKGGGNA